MLSRQFHTHRSVLQHDSPSITSRTPREQILKSTLNEITRSESLKDIKLEKQRTKIKMLTERLSSKSKAEDNNIMNLKDSVYTDLKAVNAQLINYQAMNMSLQNENNHLKELISKKDLIISQFEEVAQETTVKFNEMESIRNRQKKDEDMMNNLNREALIKEIDGLNQENQASIHRMTYLNETINALSQEKDYVIQKMNEQQLISVKEKEGDRNRMTILDNDNQTLKTKNVALMREVNETKRLFEAIQKDNERKENELQYMCQTSHQKENELKELRGILDQITQEKIMLRSKLNSSSKQNYYLSNCYNMTFQ